MTPDKESVLKHMQSVADAISDPMQKSRLERQIAMASITFNTAEQIAEQIKRLPSSQKKIFKGFNRRPRKKETYANVIIRIIVATFTARAQLSVIAAAPIPKYYPEGTSYHPGE
jgi:hypothetical protein